MSKACYIILSMINNVKIKTIIDDLRTATALKNIPERLKTSLKIEIQSKLLLKSLVVVRMYFS